MMDREKQLPRSWYSGMRAPHDPVYGISKQNIAEELTQDNWETKAVCRIWGSHTLYLTVAEREASTPHPEVQNLVKAYGTGQERCWDRGFPSLDDAISYANGADGSEFALHTRRADPSEYPPEREPDTYFTGM